MLIQYLTIFLKFSVMKNTLYNILVILFITHYTTGQQGNYKFENFDNGSILLSGNVKGSSEDIVLTH